MLGPLATERINRVMREIESRELVAARLWRSRLNRVQATDEEILAKITADVIAADIITDDAQAVVHASDQIRFSSGSVPNFKHGRMMSQHFLRLLRRIEVNLATTQERNFFDAYVADSAQRLLQGIEDRQEMVICAMLEDTVTYDRLGVKFSGMTWGMPSVLKVTPATPWSTAGSATPIADVLAVQQASVDRGGPRYNRWTGSTQAFNYMVNTTEFQNRVKFGMDTVQAGLLNLNYLSLLQKQTLAGQMLDMTFELYDGQTKIETIASGAKVNTRFQSANKVVLSFTGNDRNNAVWDFAIGEVTEAIVAGLTNLNLAVDFGDVDSAFGPFGYTTPANPTLDPPGLVQWAVDRGWPRKHDDEANAVLTVF